MEKKHLGYAVGAGVLLSFFVAATTPYYERWDTLIAFLTLYVLFLTLLSVLHYAELTASQLRLSVEAHRIAQKPIVVTDMENDRYAISNIGPGLAVNVFMVIPAGGERPKIEEMGALGPGQTTIIEPFVRGEPLEDHVILAGAMFSRTTQWIATVNVVLEVEVVHRVAVLKSLVGVPVGASVAAVASRSSQQWLLDREWGALTEQLAAAKSELHETAVQHFDVESESSFKPAGT